MNVHDAFFHTVYDSGDVEALAARMGVKAGVLRNKANPNNPANVPSLRDADLAMTFTGNYAVLHALAENHGHVCVKVDADAPAGDLAVLDLVTKVWSANGNIGTAVDEALADHVVERREVAKIRTAIYRTQQAMLAMLARLEEMAEPERTAA